MLSSLQNRQSAIQMYAHLYLNIHKVCTLVLSQFIDVHSDFLLNSKLIFILLGEVRAEQQLLTTI